MTISIFRAGPEDITSIKQIEVECGLSSWTEKDYREESDRLDNLFFTAKEDSEVLGFILARLIMNKISEPISSVEIEAEIYNIAVKRSSRRKKVGFRLLARVIESAKEKNAGKIFLEVRKSNAEAMNFYGKNGFQVITERRNFYSNPTEDAILMCCHLHDQKIT